MGSVKEISLTLDGKAVKVPAGWTLLQALEHFEIKTPVICFHDATTPEGICRQCVVEVEGRRTLLPACVTLVGDGSFGFTAAELETVSRVGGNNNIILYNNQSYGWIKAAVTFSHGLEYSDFATNFKPIDYTKIAEGFGLRTYRADDPNELRATLKEARTLDEPTFTELRVQPENELVPPVPTWIKKARDLGIRHVR